MRTGIFSGGAPPMLTFWSRLASALLIVDLRSGVGFNSSPVGVSAIVVERRESGGGGGD